MDKGEKVKDSKEGDIMQATLKQSSFSDFVRTNRSTIRKVVNSNTVKNSDGLTVIPKNDPWRKESEWDQTSKDFKDK